MRTFLRLEPRFVPGRDFDKVKSDFEICGNCKVKSGAGNGAVLSSFKGTSCRNIWRISDLGRKDFFHRRVGDPTLLVVQNNIRGFARQRPALISFSVPTGFTKKDCE
ncbi:hypothetical protein EFP84_07115 [Leptospira kmetyi]|uniref:Uncharacterized protein n=1 Tax=Leptospira kmetyi TaxID=408139 RepID=A0AAD0XQ09_9LEPT|nr:hypothetical protein EFP84_07115 [Leptospira kmetyi]